MRFKTRLKKRKVTSMDLTPLVDMVFNLLLFFMLSSRFVMQPGIQIEFPRATAVQDTKPSQITVYILRNGQYLLEDTEVALAELEGALENRMQEMKDPTLMVGPDRNVSVEALIKVLDIGQRLGMSLGILTEPED